jgi:peptidyl-prolyl cis-trans isomerase A (cyclophilin A)
MKTICLIGFLCASLAFAQEPAQPAQPAKPEPGLYATITTSMGVIKAQLFEKDAPVTVKNFMDLATGARAYVDPRNGLPSKLPLYEGLTFHRVIPKFMIQGGDPLADGTGGTKNIVDEIKPELKFDRPGRLGMANAGPGTGSCQFFITEVATPHLDGLHTIFGQVVEGQEVVGKIVQVPTQNDKPTQPVHIQKITFDRIQ